MYVSQSTAVILGTSGPLLKPVSIKHDLSKNVPSTFNSSIH